MLLALSISISVGCGELDRYLFNYRAESEHSPFVLRDASSIALNPLYPEDASDAQVSFDLDGDGSFESKTTASELPYHFTIDSNTPSVIEASVDMVVRSYPISILSADAPELTLIDRKNVLIEVSTSNTCSRCVFVENHLHDIYNHDIHADETPYIAGPLSILKHHEVMDLESSPYGLERTEELWETVFGNPQSFIDGSTPVLGWEEGVTDLALDTEIEAAFATEPSVSAQLRVWDVYSTRDNEDYLDVVIALHDLGRNWSAGELRVHVVAFEHDYIPRGGAWEIQYNNYTSRAGRILDVPALGDSDTLLFNTTLSMLNEDGNPVYVNRANLGVTVFIEDLTDCPAEGVDGSCTVLNSISGLIDGYIGQGYTRMGYEGLQ